MHIIQYVVEDTVGGDWRVGARLELGGGCGRCRVDEEGGRRRIRKD